MSPAAAALMRPAGVVQVLASPLAAVLAVLADPAASDLRVAVLAVPVASAAVLVAAASAEAGDADGWSQRGAGFFRR